MTVVFYISGHGFGHASRDIEVVHALAARRPDCRVAVRTSVPAAFFEASAAAPVELCAVTADTGVVQIDSLRLDADATARETTAFYDAFNRRVEDEARVLSRLGASVVVGDVPPLAFAAAAQAGIPSLLLANFTWDWIYRAFPTFGTHGAVIDLIGAAYAQAARGLRLPFHGGFDTVADIRDIPLIARKSALDPAGTRRLLGLAASRPVVLASFGRYGVELPIDRLAADGRFTLVINGAEDSRTGDNVVTVSTASLQRMGLKYEDLVAAADVVVSKPGYGIVSECIANDTALLYAHRDGFVEHDVFVREMPRVLRCRPIEMSDFSTGHWWKDVRALLDQPPPPERMRIDGADAAAEAILSLASGRVLSADAP